MAEAVGDQLCLAVTKDTDRTVGRAQINTDNHAYPPNNSRFCLAWPKLAGKARRRLSSGMVRVVALK
jgi:hypothetical protein